MILLEDRRRFAHHPAAAGASVGAWRSLVSAPALGAGGRRFESFRPEGGRGPLPSASSSAGQSSGLLSRRSGVQVLPGASLDESETLGRRPGGSVILLEDRRRFAHHPAAAGASVGAWRSLVSAPALGAGGRRFESFRPEGGRGPLPSASSSAGQSSGLLSRRSGVQVLPGASLDESETLGRRPGRSARSLRASAADALPPLGTGGEGAGRLRTAPVGTRARAGSGRRRFDLGR